nr:hypothetical protein [Sphingomonas changbaiensis]
MSRAINIDAPRAHVLASCSKRKLPISTIEDLRSGGTRVVMNNAADAAVIATLYGRKVITGLVQRTPLRLASR